MVSMIATYLYSPHHTLTTVEVSSSTDSVHEIEVPLTDGAVLLVAVDADGDLTMWHYPTGEYYSPVALLRACDVPTLVWDRATAGLPRVYETR